MSNEQKTGTDNDPNKDKQPSNNETDSTQPKASDPDKVSKSTDPDDTTTKDGDKSTVPTPSKEDAPTEFEAGAGAIAYGEDKDDYEYYDPEFEKHGRL